MRQIYPMLETSLHIYIVVLDFASTGNGKYNQNVWINSGLKNSLCLIWKIITWRDNRINSKRFKIYRESTTIRVFSPFSRVQIFATLSAIAHQAPLSMGFSRQEYWGRLLFPPPGDLPNAGSNSGFPHCRRILYHLSHQWSPYNHIANIKAYIIYLNIRSLLEPCALSCKYGSARSLKYVLSDKLHSALDKLWSHRC